MNIDYLRIEAIKFNNNCLENSKPMMFVSSVKIYDSKTGEYSELLKKQVPIFPNGKLTLEFENNSTKVDFTATTTKK